MKVLAQDLLLNIVLDDKNQLRLSLRDELTLSEAWIAYQVNQPTLRGGSRQYQLREAMVIAVRRLLSEAVKQGLISDDPGPWTTPTTSGTEAKPDSITFWTDEDS